MFIYKSRGKPEEYKITDNPLKDKNWEYVIGEMPKRINLFRNENSVNLTKDEIKERLSSKKMILKEVVGLIEQAESKI